MQRQVGDFVQEQRAALGGLDQALLVGHRAGEAALLVAEQLAFHQLGRDRAAVHRHERPIAARAGFVDQVRDQFFAGAGFAIDMYRRLAACDAFDHLAQLFHRARAAEQFDLRQLQRVLAGLAELQRGGDELAQRRDVERLGNEIERAELQRAHSGFDVAVRSDDRHRRLRLVRLDPLDDVQAVAVGQPHVGQAQIEGVAAQLARGRTDGVGGGHVEIHSLERDPQQLANVRLVVHDERARFRHCDFPALRIGEHEAKNTTTPAAGLIDQRGAIALRELPGDEQSEAGAALRAGEKRLEDALGIRRRDARAAVQDLQHRPVRGADAAGTELDCASLSSLRPYFSAFSHKFHIS